MIYENSISIRKDNKSVVQLAELTLDYNELREVGNKSEQLDVQKVSRQPTKCSRSNSLTSADLDEAVKRRRMAGTRLDTLVNDITSSYMVSTISLEGNSLAVRQQKLNAAVNEAHKNKIPLAEVLSSGEQTDIDNIYRIDLASKYRNVDYIIENLKSTDSLRVARALKAHWLFTDNEYSHIINPSYITTTLQPLMSDKTFGKFLRQLTLHLKDEKRCEDFYMHYLQKKDKCSIKFLINCSIEFIKARIANKDFDLSPEYLSLLSRRTHEIVSVYAEIRTQNGNKISLKHLHALRHLMDKHGDFYLDVLEENVVKDYVSFHLGQRVTREIVRNHKQRIFKRPLLYLNLLHYKQLIHSLNHDEIRRLASLVTSRNNFWSNNWLMKLLELLPHENRYNFIMSLFERDHPGEVFEMSLHFATNRWYVYMSKEQREKWALEHITQRNEYLGKLYHWYKFVNFGTSFVELKKLLRAEPDASERETMFEILVSTCDDDESNITKLLKYFHDRHINEIILFKQHSIEKIMRERNIYKCSDEVWNILNEIFLSFRLYEDINNCSYSFRQNAISHVISHHIIYDEPITEKMLKLYDECYSMLDMLVMTPWKEKVFEFVHKWIFAKVETLWATHGLTAWQVLRWTRELINLFRNFNYSPKPELIKLIKKIREHDSKHFKYLLHDPVYKEHILDSDRPPLTEVICLRNLKKDIKLLDLCKEEFTEIIKNNSMRYRKFLSKIRIYFNEDLARDWINYFLVQFKENHKDSVGCASIVFGLTVLLPAAEYEKLIKEYQPEKAKLVWSETDPCLVHIQTNIAKFMHLVRPTVNHVYLTSYAKGDFLQYSVQSIMSVSRQLPMDKCQELIVTLLASPVSVQKHGIKLAFKKYTMNELVDIFGKLWVKTENVSIKNLLFNYVHDLLTEADDDIKRLEIWKLLNSLLTQLHGNEFLTNIVDPVTRNVCKVDISVRAQYCTAYWYLLHSVQVCDQIWSYQIAILNVMAHNNVINLLDEDFLKHLIFNFLDTCFNEKEGDSKNLPSHYVSAVWPVIAKFVICCETKDDFERRSDVFKKALDYLFSRWNNTNGCFYHFLVLLMTNAQSVLNENNFCNPIHLLEYIRDRISERQPKREYYDQCLWSKLVVTLLKSLHETQASKPESFVRQCELWAEIFGKHCIELMKRESAENYPRLPQIFRHHFLKFINNESHSPYGYDRQKFYLGASRSFLMQREDLDCCLLAVECLVKVNSKPEIFAAKSLLNSIRAMDIPELNYFIDTKVGAQGNPFK